MDTPPDAPPPLSQRAYARHRGCAVEAVSRAIADGRLRASIVRTNGQAKIADPALADREWEANTTPPPGGRGMLPDGIPDLTISRAIKAAAQARKEVAQADVAEIELANLRGELISVAQARADVMAMLSRVKTRLLGVPSRVAQSMPELAARVAPVVDRFITEALEELADGAAESDAPPDL